MQLNIVSENEDRSVTWAIVDELLIYNTEDHLPPNIDACRTLKPNNLQDFVGIYRQTYLVSPDMSWDDLTQVFNQEDEIRDRRTVFQHYWAATQNIG